MSVHFDASKGVESGDTAGQSTSETYSNSTYSSRQDPPRRAAAKQQTTKSGKSFPGKMVEAIQLKLSSSKKPKNVDNTRQYSSSGSYADTYSTGDSGSSYSYYSYSTGSTATSGSSYYSWSSVRIPQNNKNQEKKSTGAPKTAAQTSLKEKKPRGDLSFDTTSRDESNTNHHNNNTSHEKQLSQAGTLPSFFVGDKISLGTASNEGGDLQDIRDNIKNLLLARSTRDKPSPGLSASVMIPSSAFPDVDNNNNSISLNASSAPNGRTSRSPSLINPETEMDLLNQQRRAPSLPPEILEGNEELKEGALIPLFKPPPKARPPIVRDITTEAVVQPPTPKEVRRRREEGRLPYPSRLTYQMVARPPLESEEIVEEQQKLQDDERNAVKVRQHKKVDAGCCGSQKRFLRRRKKAEDADAARVTMNKTVLQNHYVPVVPFQTTREGYTEEDGPTPHPLYADKTIERPLTLEEARSLQISGANKQLGPDQLSRAMRDRARPRSVHVLGHSARSYGGEEGLPNCPRSAFLGEGAPMSFWVAQLNERPVTQLDPLDEAEVFSVDSELSRLSEGDRLLDAEERINRLKELEAKRRKREQQEREQYSHFSRFSDTDTTVTSSMDVIDTAEEERQRHAELSQRKLRSISPPHVQHTMHTQSYDPYTNLF